MAETIDVEVTQISDPVIYLDGEPYIDLSGLTLQISGGATEDGSLAQYFIDLYADETNINSAILQKSGDVVSFFLGGMTSAYSMPADEFEAEVGSLEGGFGGGLANFNLDDWALPGDVGTLFSDFVAQNADPDGVRTVDVALAAGNATMAEMPFAGDCTELFYAIARAMDEDLFLTNMISSAYGEDESFEGQLKDENFQAEVKGSVAQTADGTSELVDFTLKTVSDGDDTSYTFRMLLDGSGSVQRIDAKYMMIEDGYTETVQLNGTVDGDALDLSATIIDDGEYDYLDALYDVRLKVTPGMDSASGKDSFELTVEEAYQNADFEVSGYMVERTGEAHFELSLKDKYDDVQAYFSYLPDDVPAEGAVESGAIEFGGSDGYEEFKFACAVRTYETTIDTDEFYIDPASAIDVSGMSDVEEQAALSELEKVLYDTLDKLEEAVPGLSGIVDELFGYGYDEVF